jgi:hypothetical protein
MNGSYNNQMVVVAVFAPLKQVKNSKFFSALLVIAVTWCIPLS